MHAGIGLFQESSIACKITLHIEFLERLPDNAFSPEEEALRNLIVDLLTAKGPRSFEQCLSYGRLGCALKAFAPAHHRSRMFLADWVEHRIGGEVVLCRPLGVASQMTGNAVVDKMWCQKTLLRLTDDTRPAGYPEPRKHRTRQGKG